MHKSLTILSGLIGLSLAFAPVPFPKPDTTRRDSKKLQGAWIPTSMIQESGVTVVQMPWDRMEIVKDRMIYYSNGRPNSEWIITLDASKNPKVFDVRCVQPANGAVYEGVYKLEGNTLTLCSAQPQNGGRPTSVAVTRPKQMLEVFKRAGR